MPHLAVVPSPEPDPQPSPLQALRAKRAGVAAALAQNGAVVRRLSEAANAEAAIEGELAALASRETEALREWAHGDGQAPCPEPLTNERVELGKRLAAAHAQAEAAKAAAKDIAADNVPLNTSLAEIDRQIEAEVQVIVEGEALNAFEEAKAFAAEAQASYARVLALRLWAASEARACDSRGEAEMGHGLLVLSNRLGALPQIEIAPLNSEVLGALPDWGKRILALRSGEEA